MALEHSHSFVLGFIARLSGTVPVSEGTLVTETDKASAHTVLQVDLEDRPQTKRSTPTSDSAIKLNWIP